MFNLKEALFLLALQLNSEVNFDLLKKKLDEMERVTGIEPASAAWEVAVLPLNYTRNRSVQILLYHLNFRSLLYQNLDIRANSIFDLNVAVIQPMIGIIFAKNGIKIGITP